LLYVYYNTIAKQEAKLSLGELTVYCLTTDLA